ncbi:tetratricopeptide repeat protein [Pseudomonas sp. MWU16-30317]|uniref:tetratricopeptide repeat protein n=1 Tax=Pseudomonas sp. MWU16-30317 TaxID=2878095 RepID=UPI001CFAB5A7|nr:tetratricopeptide repeat protein [Pseudomonas sp. MWU16-30317]
MGFEMRREEVLDADSLRAMLDEQPGRAAQAIVAAAGQNVVEAQALLGQILLDGRGIAQDQPLALRWFAIAADAGHLMARNMLGRCHEHGWGCTADAQEAAVHYRLAAAAGLDWGLYNYANLLSTGRGVAQDQELALACYRKAANLGHAKSMNLYGRYLEQGLACKANPAEAFDWYERSAEAGDFRGQFSHASVLASKGQVDLALAWFEEALRIGNANFLRVSGPQLESAGDPRIKVLAVRYQARLLELGGSLA